MIYELRLFNNIILKFKVEKLDLGENIFSIVDFDESKKNLLPIGMEANSESLYNFLKYRVIPKNRAFVEKILSQCGLAENDTMGIINIGKGFSLNDSYWITEENFSGTFEKYNLFENNFTKILSLIAYTGYGTNTKRGFTSSPEFTTNGMLKKCWRRIDNEVYLFKGGTWGCANSGLEPYSEFYASQIAEIMNIKHIDYNLAKWKGSLCSYCKIFTNKDISYVPIFRFVKDCSLSSVNKFIKNLGSEYYDEFCDMLIFDALIFNTDRHFGNFGLLVNSKTNKIISFAPIFDNGNSLFCEAMENDIAELEKYAQTRVPAYRDVSWDAIIKNFLSLRQKNQLRKMIGFKFKRHSRYNLNKKRLIAIEDFLQRRVDYLLKY
ncbi:MAG: hypothetical protein MJ211_14615 [Bacteroidales bacterium]|nr:hypothetical protein [Bacteroidales bacterium]